MVLSVRRGETVTRKIYVILNLVVFRYQYFMSIAKIVYNFHDMFFR